MYWGQAFGLFFLCLDFNVLKVFSIFEMSTLIMTVDLKLKLKKLKH
jgi:hypothetical protein